MMKWYGGIKLTKPAWGSVQYVSITRDSGMLLKISENPVRPWLLEPKGKLFTTHYILFYVLHPY